MRRVRQFADKLLGHLIEHILTLLEIGGYVFNRCLVIGDTTFGAVHLRLFLRQRHALAGDHELIDHHRQRNHHPECQRRRDRIENTLLQFSRYREKADLSV